jgi:hypothetical protein
MPRPAKAKIMKAMINVDITIPPKPKYGLLEDYPS